ncbi:MAG: prefoldin subunit alpha [Nanoarchaeota archaeon]
MEDDIVYRAAMLQQQSEEIESRLQFVNEQIQELEQFSGDLRVLDKNDNKEILASLGKGVYAKSELKDKKLFVQVGAGVVIKKSINETVEVIGEQIKRFEEARVQLKMQLESYAQELKRMVAEVEKIKRIGKNH